MWPTIRWSGRTLRSVTCQERCSISNVSTWWNPAGCEGEHHLLDLHGRGQVGSRRRPPAPGPRPASPACPTVGGGPGPPGRSARRCRRPRAGRPRAGRPRPGSLPRNSTMFATPRSRCSGRTSYDTTRPDGPTAPQSAIVSAPEPVPASRTRAPGRCRRRPGSARCPSGRSTCAPLGIFSTKSANRGRNATSIIPPAVSRRTPSGCPITRS